MRLLLSFLLLLLLSACGGGGSDSNTPTSNVVSTNINLSASKSYVGESATISWASNNANSCSASGDWTGDKATSGSETVTFDTSGDFIFEIVCSNTEFSDSASFLIPIFEYIPIDEEFNELTDVTWDADASLVAISGKALTDNYLYSTQGLYDLFEPIIDFRLNYTIPYLPEGLYRDTNKRNYYESNIIDVNIFKRDNNLYGISYWFSESSSNIYYINITPRISEANGISERNPQTSFWEAKYMHYRTLYDSSISQLLRPITNNIYSSPSLVEVFKEDALSIFTTRLGDITDDDDIPTSQSRQVDINLFSYIFDSNATSLDDYSNTQLEEFIIREEDAIIFGTGMSTLLFDFSNGTVSTLENDIGIRFDKFKEYGQIKDKYLSPAEQWRHEDTIASLPDITFEIRNGLISGNSFSADIMLNGSNEEHSAGFIKGNFYGPDASEVALEIIFYDIPPNQNCGYLNGTCNYKILVGSGIGAFDSPSN
ncbi:MAG: hypothetical protein GJ671_09535 [Alteromonadaceae bacterium]|nr:hypothetical protein [Alteromonadaceae bacterium]